MPRGQPSTNPARGLRQEPNGIWVIDKRIDGKRVRFSTGTRSYPTALQRLAEFTHRNGEQPESLVSIRAARTTPICAVPDCENTGWTDLVADDGKNRWLREMHGRSRRGAIARGIPFLLSFDEVKAIALASEGVCALSGIPFDLTASVRNPFAPSIDRIDATRSYSIGNCRIISLIANIALSNWGDETLIRFCDGVSRARAFRSSP